jgi:hypothetical protein
MAVALPTRGGLCNPLILCTRHLPQARDNSILDQYFVILRLIADAPHAMSDEATNRPASSALAREDLLNALRALSDKLGEQGVTGELCLFGGTVMVLAFSARLATKDIDALFKPAKTIRELAGRLATELHLPTDWLNDGMKRFLSARHETTGSCPAEWCTSRDFQFGWTRAQLTTADSRAG